MRNSNGLLNYRKDWINKLKRKTKKFKQFKAN